MMYYITSNYATTLETPTWKRIALAEEVMRLVREENDMDSDTQLHDRITTYIMVSRDALKESAIRGYRRDIYMESKNMGLWDNLYRSSVHK